MPTWSFSIIFMGAFFQAANLLAQSQAMPIDTKREYFKHIVGKRLVDAKGNSLIISADGRFAGVTGGQKYSGTWRWSLGSACRTLIIDNKQDVACNSWVKMGNRFRAVRDRGRSKKYREFIVQE